LIFSNEPSGCLQGDEFLKKFVIVFLAFVFLTAAAFVLQKQGLLAAYLPTALVSESKQVTAKPSARPPSAVEVAMSKQQELSDDISAVGSLVSEESVDIAAETNGRIAEILFKDGENVTEGDILFRLDQTLLQAQVNDAVARLALAKTVMERNTTLVKSRNIAQSVFDESKTSLTLAESALALSQAQLEKLTIRAPFSGQAGFRGVSVGAYVQAGAALVHIEKIDTLKAAFSVPELYFPRLSPQQTVIVTADAVPNENFEAKISAINALVDINGRALQVRATLDNRANKLRPGMLIRVTVRGPPRNSITVPEAAVVPRSNGAVVFTTADKKAKEVKVTLGKRSNGEVEILEGLKAGEQVIIAGNSRLADGAVIAIVPSAMN
jgi:membrane fusion protein, multidrug efflux system